MDPADTLNIIQFTDDCRMLDRIVLEYHPSVLLLKVSIKFQRAIGGGESRPLLAEQGIRVVNGARIHNNSYPLDWDISIVVRCRLHCIQKIQLNDSKVKLKDAEGAIKELMLVDLKQILDNSI